ncbi:MAG: hypothetical protein ACE5F7_11630, partial [Nitrospiria bacterium]
MPYKKKIKGKLFFCLLLFSLTPLLITAYFSYGRLGPVFVHAARSELALDVLERERDLLALLGAYQQRLNVFSGNEALQNLLDDLNRAQ